MSIKRFILFWMGGQTLCFVALATFLILAADRLQTMNAQILSDTTDSDLANQLETAILAETREELLNRFTPREVHNQQKTMYFDRAVAAADQLTRANINSDEEAKLVKRVEDLFARFLTTMTSAPLLPMEQIIPTSEQLLRAAEDLKAWEQEQMAKTLASSTLLDRTVYRWSNVMILFVFLIGASGSLLLVKRIVLPIFALSQTTRKFGRGEFDARAQVPQNDEFGLLCKSFNAMAGNIQTLQEERLHFIAAVAHDLKNPLILVGATARRLKKKLTITAEQVELMDRLIEQSRRAEEMISDLMESVQMQTGKLKLNLDEIDVDSLVNGIYRHQSALIASHQILLEGECRSWIRGDARRLERVLANLISNAVKYSPRHSPVRIKMELNGSEAVISVRDEGAGIPVASIPTLFQPFQRLAHTRNMAQGTGLGLFSVKKIIESHGGTIAIESTLGQGTTVTIVLPILRSA